jgi:hypothetical protein
VSEFKTRFIPFPLLQQITEIVIPYILLFKKYLYIDDNICCHYCSRLLTALKIIWAGRTDNQFQPYCLSSRNAATVVP